MREVLFIGTSQGFTSGTSCWIKRWRRGMRRLFVMALTAAASVWAGVGQWTSLGGPDGGNIAMLAIDPNTPDTIYAARNGGSIFKSIDGGTRWTVTDFPVGRLIVAPKDGRTLY